MINIILLIFVIFLLMIYMIYVLVEERNGISASSLNIHYIMKLTTFCIWMWWKRWKSAFEKKIRITMVKFFTAFKEIYYMKKELIITIQLIFFL